MSEDANGAASAGKAEGERPGVFRRTWVIDRSFQLKYTGMLVLVGVLVSAVFGGTMYLAHLSFRRSLILAGGSDLVPRGDSMGVTLFAVSAAMAVALGLFGLVLTHRVAGPLFVISGYVQSLERGRYPRMRALRNGDELQAFFARFQTAVESMRLREAEEAKRMEEALAALRDPAAEASSRTAALVVLDTIRQRKLDATDLPDVGRT